MLLPELKAQFDGELLVFNRSAQGENSTKRLAKSGHDSPARIELPINGARNSPTFLRKIGAQGIKRYFSKNPALARDRFVAR